MARFTAACLCGDIRYVAEAEPLFMAVCHCKDCQRATGSAFEAVVAIPEAGLSLQGAPSTFSVTADSGREIHRSFCPKCGSTLLHRADAVPGALFLTTGPMDDTTGFEPSRELYCDSAQAWLHLGGERRRYPRMPAIPGTPDRG